MQFSTNVDRTSLRGLSLDSIIYGILSAVVVASVGLFLFLTIGDIASGYSYWLDEIFSVSASKGSNELFLAYLGYDFHPPLYQTILRGWIAVFGDSEIATRSLSMLFASLAMVTLFGLWNLLPRDQFLLMLAFFASQPLVFFYAQETRVYALLLLATTASMVFFLRGNRRLTIFSALVLGCCHFFGVLMALLVMLALMVQRRLTRGEMIAILASAAIVLFWPVFQVFFGPAGDAMGGNFWIKTTPVGAIGMGFEAALPGLAAVLRKVAEVSGIGIELLTVALLLGAAVVLGAMIWRLGRSYLAELTPQSRMLAMVALIYTGMVVGVAIVSLHTPVATIRNFVVLVPFGCYLLSALLFPFLRTGAVTAGIALSVLLLNTALSFVLTDKLLEPKTAPKENWKAAALAAAEEARATGYPVTYYNAAAGFRPMLDPVYRYYLPEDVEFIPRSYTDLADLHVPSVVLFGHERCSEANVNEALRDIANAGYTFSYSLAPQYAECGTGHAVVGTPVVATIAD